MRRFRLTPRFDNSAKYYWVYIFKTKENMYESLKGVHHDDCEAICQNYERYFINPDGTETINDNIGRISFYEDFLGVGIVAHELTHAALYYFTHIMGNKLEDTKATRNGEFAGELEEDFCTLIQVLNREFWTKYEKSLL
jgi:hypothetical protein